MSKFPLCEAVGLPTEYIESGVYIDATEVELLFEKHKGANPKEHSFIHIQLPEVPQPVTSDEILALLTNSMSMTEFDNLRAELRGRITKWGFK